MVLIALRGAGLILIAFSEIFFLNERASLFFFSSSNNSAQETIFFDTYILKTHPCKMDLFLATTFCFITGIKNKKGGVNWLQQFWYAHGWLFSWPGNHFHLWCLASFICLIYLLLVGRRWSRGGRPSEPAVVSRKRTVVFGLGIRHHLLLAECFKKAPREFKGWLRNFGPNLVAVRQMNRLVARLVGCWGVR